MEISLLDTTPQHFQRWVSRAKADFADKDPALVPADIPSVVHASRPEVSWILVRGRRERS